MARIRSVFPGLWTDEQFVTLSMPARLFLIGIWTEADDFGILEWRPKRLKMRLAPCDAIDAEVLMEELVDAKFLVKFARNGVTYAAVKNFRKYQRPKNPADPLIEIDDVLRVVIGLANEVIPPHGVPPIKGTITTEGAKKEHPTPALPQEVGIPTPALPPNGVALPPNGVGVPPNGVALPPNGVGVPPNGVRSPQMEDGGDKKGGDKERNAHAREAEALAADFEAWYAGYPNKVGRADAAKSYLRSRRNGVSQDALCRGRDRYVHSKPPDRAWCNPATWLNQERWKDEPAPVYTLERPDVRQGSQSVQQAAHELYDEVCAGIEERRREAALRDATHDHAPRLLSAGGGV
jgi:hypothetical protein